VREQYIIYNCVFHIVGGRNVYNFTYLLKNRDSRACTVGNFRLLFMWLESVDVMIYLSFSSVFLLYMFTIFL